MAQLTIPGRSFLFRTWTALASSALLLALLAHSVAAGSRDKPVEPLWQIDLKTYGKTVPQKGWSFWLGTSGHLGIVFIKPNLVADYFIYPAGSNALQIRGEPRQSDPFHMRAVLLDIKNRKVLVAPDWPVLVKANAYLFPTRNGNFIRAARDSLILYSTDLSKLAEHGFSWSNTASIPWDSSISDDGTSLLVHRPMENQSGTSGHDEYYLFDTSLLSLLGAWKADIYRPISAWGTEMVWRAGGSNLLQPTDRDIYYMKLGGEPRRSCPVFS